MPEISIWTERGRVHADVSGSTSYGRGDVKGELGLDRATLRRALAKLSGDGDYSQLMLFGYTLSFRPLNDDVTVDESSRIIGLTNDVLKNNSNVTGTYTTSLEHTVTHSVEVKWTEKREITTGLKVEANLGISAGANMDFTMSTGKDTTRSVSETISANRQLSVSLRPGERVNTTLQVTKRTIKVRIPFKVEILGHLAASWDSSPITYQLRDVLRAAGKRASYTTTAVVEMECFTDAEVEMY